MRNICDNEKLLNKRLPLHKITKSGLFQQCWYRRTVEASFLSLRTRYIFLNVLCNTSFNGFRIGTVYDIHLFTILKVVKRRNRSNTLPLHQFGCFWGSITDNLKKHGIGILFTKIFKLGSNHLTGTAPAEQRWIGKSREWGGQEHSNHSNLTLFYHPRFRFWKDTHLRRSQEELANQILPCCTVIYHHQRGSSILDRTVEGSFFVNINDGHQWRRHRTRPLSDRQICRRCESIGRKKSTECQGEREIFVHGIEYRRLFYGWYGLWWVPMMIGIQ